MAITKKMLEDFAAPLKVDELQFIPNFQGKTKKPGLLKVMTYITGRACTDRLRDVFGIGNYQVSYRPVLKIGGEDAMICTLRLKVLDEETNTSEWISLEDICETSNISAAKGSASGSLKRVCVLVGLGRQLYDLPHLYVETNDDKAIPDWAYSKLKSVVQDCLEGRDNSFVHYIKQDQSLSAQSPNNTSPTQSTQPAPKGSFTPPTKPAFGK